jgi:hypothetical protein
MSETDDMEESEVALTVRVPGFTLQRVDALVRARPTRIPRHSWLLEAIYEKLSKEERVRGNLEVRWQNSGAIGMPATYLLLFLRSDRRRSSPVAPMTVVGDDCLEGHLVEWGSTLENAKAWIQKLRADRTISVHDVIMPASRAGRYGFRVPGWGIQLNLADGRQAILDPDHPLSRPDGCRVRILAVDGQVEKEGVVSPDGKVRIILGKLSGPGDPPRKVTVNCREASKTETEEFLDAYRRCVPD